MVAVATGASRGTDGDDKHRNNSPQICLTPATASFILVALTLLRSSDGNDGVGDNGDVGDGDNGDGEVGSTVSFIAIAGMVGSLSMGRGASLFHCIDRVR